MYYPKSDIEKLYLNKNEIKNNIKFYTLKTNKKNKLYQRNDKSYKISRDALSYIWRQRALGLPICDIMKQLMILYSSKMQDILHEYYDQNTNTIDLEREFRGDDKNGVRYASGSLLNRNTIDYILKDIQRGYARNKWKQFLATYHARPVQEISFDATFGVCSKLYSIKDGVWHLLKLSFGHIEDDIGLTPEGLILSNAAESHDVLVDFITDFVALNIKNCRYEHTNYTIKIGTDNSGRDKNIGDKIIKLLGKKLGIQRYNPIHYNDYGVPFDITRLKIIVKSPIC